MSHVVLTGPIRGKVTLKSGKEIDVRPDVVEVDSPEEAAEVAHLIGERYAAEGHPDHEHGQPFIHTPHPDFVGYTPHHANKSIHREG